jgi:hypothetical protein
MVPIIAPETLPYVEDFDKFLARSEADDRILELQQQMEFKVKFIQEELVSINNANFKSFYDKCAEFPEISGKKCDAIVKKNITALLKEINGYIKTVREQIKTIRNEIGRFKKGKQSRIFLIKEKIKRSPTLFELYKQSTYAAIRDKCSSKTLQGTHFLEAVNTLPEVAELDREIVATKENIEMLQNQLDLEIKAFKQTIKDMKAMLKRSDLAPIEKTAIEFSIREKEKDFRQTKKMRSKIINDTINNNKKKMTEMEKDKKLLFKTIRKTLKQRESLKKKEEKAAMTLAKKLAKKTDSILTEIKDDEVKGMTQRREQLIEHDLENTQKEIVEKQREMMRKKREKEEELVQKTRAKQVAKTLKQREKEQKDLEKLREKARKEEEKQQNKTRKHQEKIAERERAMTRKLQEKERAKAEKAAKKK